MLTIDGSSGEGGGQILRTSLALSLVTGKPFRMERIRAQRPKPGLARQHLTAVRAAAEVGQAEVEGAELGARELVFVPGEVRPGEYRFDVGSAGSTTLVLQTVLPALMIAGGPSRLWLEGGTHNIYAPPVDFLEKAFLPILARMGPKVEVTTERPGFYPAGGGCIRASIQPEPRLRRIELTERGRTLRRAARGVVSRLPLHIAEREVDVVRRRMSWPAECVSTRQVESSGPGNVISIEIQSEHVTEVFTGFGRLGVPAEKVAAGAVREARRYLKAGVPVGEHLADQLLIPLALAGGGAFRTLAPSSHTTTNVETLGHFLDVSIRVEQVEKDVWQIAVDGLESHS
ncbi:MAG: RNA 3'-terminal phosphate cyclase [Planctomycetota bacterium]